MDLAQQLRASIPELALTQAQTALRNGKPSFCSPATDDSFNSGVMATETETYVKGNLKSPISAFPFSTQIKEPSTVMDDTKEIIMFPVTSRIMCNMSFPDHDAYSIRPYYKTGHLTLLLNRAAHFATSWVEIMFFRYIPPNLPGQRDLSVKLFPSASASATLSSRAMFVSRQTAGMIVH